MKFITETAYESNRYFDPSISRMTVTGYPKKLGLELTFQINSPTRHSDMELKVIRAFPMNFEFAETVVDKSL